MLQGLRTAIYYVADMNAAKDWYRTVVGFDPYFDQPYYIGFNVGGYELGLHPLESASLEHSEGVVTYWGVENAEAAFTRLIALGATVHQNVMDVGEGIKVGSVYDPFGNIFGIIQNPHFRLEKQKEQR